MKRIRCPKCENYLTFDETKYTEGQSLVFVCDQCDISGRASHIQASFCKTVFCK